VAIGLVVLTLMTTWKRGRELLGVLMHRASLPLDALLADVGRKRMLRVQGTAVFLTSDTEGAPVVLLHHLKHNKVLHEQVVLVSILSAGVPVVEDSERLAVTVLDHGFFRVIARFGFMETPNVPRLLAACEEYGLRVRPIETSYFLGRERLLPIGPSPMMQWRKKLFSFMVRNARSATDFFGIPPNRVIELGAQIEF
jgi:KUP system potassium uptake protein